MEEARGLVTIRGALRALALLLVLSAPPLSAHPGVGIVMDARGNVFYTDLKQVWKITPDRSKSVAVPHVHTHELFLDAQGNLYGEHLWYEGEASNRWGHRVWRLSPDGVLTDIVPAREGFRTDYSFVRDAAGNMYSVTQKNPTAFRKRAPDGTITTIALCRDCRNVRWMTAAADGTLYFTDSGDLREISPAGTIRTLARGLAGGARTERPEEDWRLVMGLWTDAARNVYVAVYGSRVVKRVSPDGRVAVVAASSFPWAPTGGLIAPNGDLWLLESTFTNAVRVRHIAGVGASGSPAPPRVTAAERAECLRVLDRATAPVETAVRSFEMARAGQETAARVVLARAREARNLLESSLVRGSCTGSKDEELIYLNHLLLGFDGWLAARARLPSATYDLASIVRRARVHRERGRASLE